MTAHIFIHRYTNDTPKKKPDCDPPSDGGKWTVQNLGFQNSCVLATLNASCHETCHVRYLGRKWSRVLLTSFYPAVYCVQSCVCAAYLRSPYTTAKYGQRVIALHRIQSTTRCSCLCSVFHNNTTSEYTRKDQTGGKDHEQRKNHLVCAHVIDGGLAMTKTRNPASRRGCPSVGERVTFRTNHSSQNSCSSSLWPRSWLPVSREKVLNIHGRLSELFACSPTDTTPSGNPPPLASANPRVSVDCHPAKLFRCHHGGASVSLARRQEYFVMNSAKRP